MHLNLNKIQKMDTTPLKYLWNKGILAQTHMLKQFINVNSNSVSSNYFYYFRR